MPHVLIAGRIHDAGLDVLRSAPDLTFEMVDEVSTESFAPLIPRADALLIRSQPLPAAVVAQAPKLRIVSRHGVGYDAVDVPSLEARGIPLTIVGDVNSRPVAEHTLALMLGLAKRITLHDRATRNAGWNLRNDFGAAELWGKTLLVVGFGRIGRLVKDLAAAFGMTVLAYDPFQPPEAIRAAGAAPVADLAEGLSRADWVSLHLPKTGSKPLIGAAELAEMKPGAFLINTARGGLVDEEAAADALAAGRLAGFGTDVFASEPPLQNRLFASERTLVSPHSASLTAECAVRMSRAAAENIVNFFAGRLDPALVVNRPGG